MRIDKYLANMNVGSRKEVHQLIKKGVVAVNGKTVKLEDSQEYYSNLVIESLTSDKMVVRMVYSELSTGEEGHYHSGDITNTYIKKY